MLELVGASRAWVEGRDELGLDERAVLGVDHAAQHRGPEDRVAVGQAQHLSEARVGDDAVGREVAGEDAGPGRRDRQPEPLAVTSASARTRCVTSSGWCSTARTAPSSRSPPWRPDRSRE